MYIYKNGCLQKNMIIACTTTVSYSYLLSGKILHISILSNKILYKEKFLWLQLYNKQTNIYNIAFQIEIFHQILFCKSARK